MPNLCTSDTDFSLIVEHKFWLRVLSVSPRAGVRVVTVCWTQCWSYVVPGQASLHGTARPPWPHAAMPWPLYTQSHSLDNWQPKQRRSFGQHVLRSFRFALAYSFSLLSSQASYWPSLPVLRSASGETWLHSPLVLAVTRRQEAACSVPRFTIHHNAGLLWTRWLPGILGDALTIS